MISHNYLNNSKSQISKNFYQSKKASMVQGELFSQMDIDEEK